MEELKPCPHCGSFGEVEQTFGIGNESHLFYIVECAKCWCKTRFCDTEEEAIAAWNQRAERTYKRIIKTNERPGKTVFNQWYACAGCGSPVNPSDNYCHHCDAKVVG